ncbi:MAG: EAL domain-containing protein [Oscillospiraceae bacterium]
MVNNNGSGELFLDEKSYEHILSQTQDIVFEWDYITKRIYHTDIFERKFGYSANSDNFPNPDVISSLVHPDDLAAFYSTYLAYDGGSSSSVGEFRIKDVEGNYEWYRSSSTAMTNDSGKLLKVLGILSNIDTQKKETIFATNLAMRDGLTGLYNRMASENLINQYIQPGCANGAMFIIDIDNFKTINDTMGHQFGDGVLVSAANSLLTLFRKGDIIGRLGGDEFIVFMTNIGETYNVKRRAKDLIGTIKAPFQNKKHYPLDISGSVGVALFPQNGTSFDELYRNADIALYRSKSYGKNRYTLFNENFLLDGVESGVLTGIERNVALSKNVDEIIGVTDNIIYICDATNYRLMYLNEAAKLTYHLTDADLGKPCYHVFHGRSCACDSCQVGSLSFNEFTVRESFHPIIGKNFLVRGKLISWNGITSQIVFATDITQQVNQRNEAVLESFLKQQLIEIVEQISTAPSLEQGAKSAFLSLCRLYGGTGIMQFKLPTEKQLFVDGTFSMFSKDGAPFSMDALPDSVTFHQAVTKDFCRLVVNGANTHVETAFFDVGQNNTTLTLDNLAFAKEHGITSVLVYLSSIMMPDTLVAILNPCKHLSHLDISGKIVHFLENQLQKQVLSQKINAERDRYRILVSSISDNVFEYDVAENDLTLYINDYERYGMADGMLIYKNALDYKKSSFDGSSFVTDEVFNKLHCVFIGKSDEPFEFVTSTANHQELWLSINPKKIFDSKGALLRVVGTLKDVTANHLAPEKSELNTLKVELEYRKGHDHLTGLHNKHRFYETVQYLIEANPNTEFAIVRFDISGFKVINELFGMEEGDHLLIYLADIIRKTLGGAQNIAFARFEADIFYACLPYDTNVLMTYRKTFEAAISQYKLDFKIIFSYGVYIIDNKELPIEIMCDRASIAQSTIKSNYVKRVATYDAILRDRLLNEQQIVNDMTDSLENGQFKVFYQPKVDLASGKTVGAEALVRWFHPQKGMISPADFIPIFEKNGFIMKLDSYVWDEVCRQLKEWIDRDMRLIPVSVNVSRIDMYNPQLCESLTSLCRKYKIPPNLLELEITESSYTNATVNLVEITKKLTFAGFTVMMDDFGSGYSSLNMLKDVPVDVLKVDLNFLSDRETTGKGASILSSVIRMARWLKMPVIAEGVETREQADFLRSIGCEMAQGFYFAKPMSAADYEKYLAEQERLIKDSTYLPASFKLDLDEIWGANAQVNMLFNTLVSSVAIVEFTPQLEKLELLRVNGGYYDLLGFTDENRHTAIAENGLDWVLPQDRSLVLQMFMEGVANKNAATTKYRRYRADKSIIWVEVNLKYIADDGEKFIFYSAMNDITREKKAELVLQAHRERYQLLAQYTATMTFEYDVEKDIFEHNSPAPNDFSGTLTAKQLGGFVRLSPIFHPNSRRAILSYLDNISNIHGKHILRLMLSLNGSCKPYTATFFSIEDENNITLRVIGIIMEENEFGINDHNEALTLLRSMSYTFPGAISRIEIKGGVFTLIYANDGFYSMYGYSANDFEAFYAALNSTKSGSAEFNSARQAMHNAIEQRLVSISIDENVTCKNGVVKRIHSNRVITYSSDDTIIVTGLDIEIEDGATLDPLIADNTL